MALTHSVDLDVADVAQRDRQTLYHVSLTDLDFKDRRTGPDGWKTESQVHALSLSLSFSLASPSTFLCRLFSLVEHWKYLVDGQRVDENQAEKSLLMPTGLQMSTHPGALRMVAVWIGRNWIFHPIDLFLPAYEIIGADSAADEDWDFCIRFSGQRDGKGTRARRNVNFWFIERDW